MSAPGLVAQWTVPDIVIAWQYPLHDCSNVQPMPERHDVDDDDEAETHSFEKSVEFIFSYSVFLAIPYKCIDRYDLACVCVI